MTRPIHTEVIEGNDVWFASRVTLPNQQQLQQSGTNGVAASGDLITVDLIRESVVSGQRDAKRLLTETSSANVPTYVFNALEFDYWDGHDDIGYNFLYQLPYTGTNPDYTLEGGNDYYVEFAILTTNFGTIRWSAKLHVRGLHSI